MRHSIPLMGVLRASTTVQTCTIVSIVRRKVMAGPLAQATVLSRSPLLHHMVVRESHLRESAAKVRASGDYLTHLQVHLAPCKGTVRDQRRLESWKASFLVQLASSAPLHSPLGSRDLERYKIRWDEAIAERDAKVEMENCWKTRGEPYQKTCLP